MLKKKMLVFVMLMALTITLVPSAFTAQAAEVDPENAVAVNVTSNVYYDTLESALSSAALGQTVVLLHSYELAESITVGPLVTLTIPTDINKTDDTTTGSNVSGNSTNGEAKVVLTVPEGKSITVNGTLLVAGNQQSTQPRSGYLTGNYGAIDVEGTIIVNGILYARGSIFTNGTGSITANSGSSVYERFEIADWRGGTASFAANNAGVFPFSLYELGGIDVETTYNNGSLIYGQSYIYASNTDVYVTVNYLGTNGLVKPVGNGGTVTMTKADNVTTATVTGQFETGNLSFEIYILGFMYPITSEGKDCPFGYNFDLDLADGTNVTINGNLKILPGCDLTVEEGATVNIAEGSSALFFTADGYSNTWNYAGWPAESVNVGDATLNIVTTETGAGTVNGLVGSTSATLDNIKGLGTLTPTGSKTIVELTQSSTRVTPVDVEFHTITLPVTAE